MVEHALSTARLWRRAAVEMTEQALALAKAQFFDPVADAELGEIAELPRLTSLLARLERLDGQELIAEYREWEIIAPNLTAAMVQAARSCERAERLVVKRLLRDYESAEFASH